MHTLRPELFGKDEFCVKILEKVNLSQKLGALIKLLNYF